MADTSQTEELEPSTRLWGIMANDTLKSMEQKILPVMCLLIQTNIHYYTDFTAVQLCAKQGIYVLWEQGFHLFVHYGYARTVSLAVTEQPIWVSRNPTLGFYGRQSVSLFFQRMHNCSFIGQILFALLRKFCSIKFNGTNLNKAILSMLDWKASKLYFSWSHRLKQERKITVIFPTYLLLYLKKQSYILILEYNYISSWNLYTDFQKRANHWCQLLPCK